MPLLSYTVRPEDLGLFKMRDFEAEIIDILLDGKLVSINNLLEVQGKAVFNWQIKNRTIRIYYRYLGGRNQYSTRKAYSMHTAGFQIPFNLKSKQNG